MHDYNRRETNGLWDVDDKLIDRPFVKLQREHSPLVEATVEQWGCYQFDNAPVPTALKEFTERFVEMLGIKSRSGLSSISEICHTMLIRIEYNEPYFYLVDTKVQLAHTEMAHTYQHKVTGDILDPCKIEVFRLIKDWDYKPYFIVKNMMEHPGMIAFLRNNSMPTKVDAQTGQTVPMFRSRDEAMINLLSKMSEVVWGKFGFLEDMVTEAMDNYVEEMVFPEGEHPRRSTGNWFQDDLPFWIAATLGVLTWLKGPAALEFLANYHQVYAVLFGIDHIGNIYPLEEAGGEAIVDGTEIYTRKNIRFIEDRKPDSCACCGVESHCTKYVNVTALSHPTCSCGSPINPLVTDGCGHGSRNCMAYVSKYPSKQGYVCQRCIHSLVNRLPKDIQCGRAACPAMNCPHHMGQAARLEALTQQRTRQLTGSTAS